MKRLQVYRGLVSRCAPGAHEAAAGMLARADIPHHGVLDLAAGSGAFLARLRDAGFEDLHAIELDSAQFGLEGVQVQSIDLNGDFAGRFEGRRFNVITATEIIEHLDNPRHFLREVHALLGDEGWLLVSTPNVASWMGRLKFLLRGELRGFEEHNYHFQRHITPITDAQMRPLLKETGFELAAHRSAGDFFGPAKLLATLPARWAIRLIGGSACVGDVSIYLARRLSIG